MTSFREGLRTGMWQAVLKEGWGQCELVWPDLLRSVAQLLGRFTCHDYMIRTLNNFMLDGKLQCSLEGPKTSLLTKLAFVTCLGCPSYVPFLVRAVVRWLLDKFQFPLLKSPSPRLALEVSVVERTVFFTNICYPTLVTEAFSQSVGHSWGGEIYRIVFTVLAKFLWMLAIDTWSVVF